MTRIDQVKVASFGRPQKLSKSDYGNVRSLKVIHMHPVRVILWTVVMAYSGFLLTGQGLRTFNSLSMTEAFLGALTGFLLAMMFTLRERRRQRPAVVTYPIEQIFPNWGKSRENGGSQPRPKG